MIKEFPAIRQVPIQDHGSFSRTPGMPDASMAMPGILGSSKERQPMQLSYRNWTAADTQAIHALEESAWPPGLRRPRRHIETIAREYPETQFMGTTPEGLVVATVTAQRIQLNGESPLKDTLWTDIKWDDVAGGSVDEGNYPGYAPEGNTLCLMSASIHPTQRGQEFGKGALIHAIKEAKKLGIEYVIGPFRPSGYGKLRSTTENPPSFEEYVQRKGPDGKLADHWLGVAESLGMEPLGVVNPSMTVTVTRKTFERYMEDPFFSHPRFQRPTNGAPWPIANEDGTVDLKDTGVWKIKGNQAIYREGNVWMGAHIDSLILAA